MKNIIVRMLITVAGGLTLGLSAHAQNSSQYRANVPFDFLAGDRTYTAGKYTVGPVSGLSSKDAIVLLEKKTGRARIIGIDNQGGQHGLTGKLIFQKMGDRYVLTEVATPTFGLKMRAPRHRPMIASNKTAGDVVEVALN